jgi:hypothetical protein
MREQGKKRKADGPESLAKVARGEISTPKTVARDASMGEIKASDTSSLSVEEFYALYADKFDQFTEGGFVEDFLYHPGDIAEGIFGYLVLQRELEKYEPSWNGRFFVRDKPIFCRHLAWRFLIKNKKMDEDFVSDDAISKAYSGSADYDKEQIASKAIKYYVSPYEKNKADALGVMLFAVASVTPRGEVAACILSSTTHAMAIRLWQKTDYWVMQFFEPNEKGYRRFVIREKEDFKVFKLSHLMDKASVERYFSPCAVSSLSLYGRVTEVGRALPRVNVIGDFASISAKTWLGMFKLGLQISNENFAIVCFKKAVTLLQLEECRDALFADRRLNIHLAPDVYLGADALVAHVISRPKVFLVVAMKVLSLRSDVFSDDFKWKCLSFSRLYDRDVEFPHCKGDFLTLYHLLEHDRETAIRFMWVIMHANERGCPLSLKRDLLQVSRGGKSLLAKALKNRNMSFIPRYINAMVVAAKMNENEFDITGIIRAENDDKVSIFYQLMFAGDELNASKLILAVPRGYSNYTAAMLTPNASESAKILALPDAELAAWRRMINWLKTRMSDSISCVVFADGQALAGLARRINCLDEKGPIKLAAP